MIKNRKILWLASISSLLLAATLLAACGSDIPDETVPTQPAETGSVSAENDASEAVEVVNELSEIFDDAADSSDKSEAALADSEVDAKGVPIGFTENGNPYRGNPNAPIVIEEFSDYQ
jgi:protein-disulfide isomerase